MRKLLFFMNCLPVTSQVRSQEFCYVRNTGYHAFPFCIIAVRQYFHAVARASWQNIHQSLKPLTSEVNDVDNLDTMHCSCGKWLPGIHVETT